MKIKINERLKLKLRENEKVIEHIQETIQKTNYLNKKTGSFIGEIVFIQKKADFLSSHKNTELTNTEYKNDDKFDLEISILVIQTLLVSDELQCSAENSELIQLKIE